MSIRLGKLEDFEKLDWAWRNNNFTQNIYKKNIEKGFQEFLVYDEGKSLIGEIHIVWNSEDLNEANGKDRAYICAFIIHPDFRGKGLGKLLFDNAIERIKFKGFTEVTLGVYQNNKLCFKIKKLLKKIINPEFIDISDKLINMYTKWGFEVFGIKDKDIHNFDITGKSLKQKIILLKKNLG